MPFHFQQLFGLAIAMIALLGMFGFVENRYRWFKLNLALLGFVVIACVGCGAVGNSPASGSGPSSMTGTPAGTSTLTITATAGSTQSTSTFPLTLTVK
jgi:hypothetical protein